MVFKCQEDSFLKEFSSSVISCEPNSFTVSEANKDTVIEGYEVILEDTILFPEGGGQPCDYGYLNNEKVLQVLRRGDKAIHYVKNPLTIGEKVVEKVDWTRRFDHMQQHSGQHLITAIIDVEFNFPTVSWYLGEDVAYIELDTPNFNQEQIDKIENICNNLIRENRRVTVENYENSVQEKFIDVRTRGLPNDHVGPVRVITIEGIDSNMCCGTHVCSLSQLQCIKLLYTTKSKRKNKVLLYFLIGNRVFNKFDKLLKCEEELTRLLKTNSSQHPEFVEKLIQRDKELTKKIQNTQKTLAVYEAEKIKTTEGKFVELHSKDADSAFMNDIIKNIGKTEKLLFLSVGEDKGPGNIMLYGNEKCISDLSNKICMILNGKGAGQGNKFQAKVANLSRRKEVVKLIQDYFM